MCRPKTKRGADRVARPIAAAGLAIGLGVWLAGCSDIYTDRRETVALGGGDATAANEVTQMVDPWPRQSGDKNIAYNGQRMQAAVERYRNNVVIPPIGATTSEVVIPPGATAAAPPSSGTPAAASGAPNAPTTTASQ